LRSRATRSSAAGGAIASISPRSKGERSWLRRRSKAPTRTALTKPASYSGRGCPTAWRAAPRRRVADRTERPALAEGVNTVEDEVGAVAGFEGVVDRVDPRGSVRAVAVTMRFVVK
jgi:hypothetical protein